MGDNEQTHPGTRSFKTRKRTALDYVTGIISIAGLTLGWNVVNDLRNFKAARDEAAEKRAAEILASCQHSVDLETTRAKEEETGLKTEDRSIRERIDRLYSGRGR